MDIHDHHLIPVRYEKVSLMGHYLDIDVDNDVGIAKDCMHPDSVIKVWATDIVPKALVFDNDSIVILHRPVVIDVSSNTCITLLVNGSSLNTEIVYNNGSNYIFSVGELIKTVNDSYLIIVRTANSPNDHQLPCAPIKKPSLSIAEYALLYRPKLKLVSEHIWSYSRGLYSNIWIFKIPDINNI